MQGESRSATLPQEGGSLPPEPKIQEVTPTEERTAAVHMLSVAHLAPMRLEPERRRVRDLRLNINMTMRLASGPLRKITVLMDTGSEVNLIRRGIVGPEHLRPVKRPMKIAAAGMTILSGGDQEVECLLEIPGIERDTKMERNREERRMARILFSSLSQEG